MKAKILSTFVAVIMAISCTAYAEISIDSPLFDYNTLKLDISGNTDNTYSEGVTISVLPFSLDRDKASDADINGNKVHYDYIVSESDGSFAYSVILGGGFPAGKYAVYADTVSGTAKDFFVFVDIDEALPVIERINTAANAAAVKDILDADCSEIGIDAEEYAQYDSYISNVIYRSKPNRGYDFDSITHQFYVAYTMALLKNGEMTLSEIIDEYASLIGINAGDYKNLSDSAKTALERLVKAETGLSGDLYRYDYNFVLAQVQTVSGYEALGDIIISNASFIGVDLTKYNSIKNNYYKNKVAEEVYGATYNSLESVKSNWDNAVDTYYEQWKKSGQTGGGGGTAGGGLGGTGFNVTSGGNGNENLFDADGNTQFTEDKSEHFNDIVGHWSYATINKMYIRGIVNGYEDGTFRPDNSVTRAEFVKMLMGALNMGSANTEGMEFSDVNSSDWYAECVFSAAANNIVKGYDGMFRPLENIKRQDAAVIIYNALSALGIKPQGEKSFNDTDAIADYAKVHVSTLAANGVINGSGGMFLPSDTLTRAEAATLIENMLRYTGK